jgi:hypothetical protein
MPTGEFGVVVLLIAQIGLLTCCARTNAAGYIRERVPICRAYARELDVPRLCGTCLKAVGVVLGATVLFGAFGLLRCCLDRLV